MDDLQNINETIFESIKHYDEDGNEYWLARELLSVLQYNEYRFFKNVINKAIDSAINSNMDENYHFVQTHDMIPIGKGGFRKVENYKLTRYACYLIAMNSDAHKEAVALAQTYFAVKTRQQELSENFNSLTENQKRIGIRQELRSHNSSLAEAAQNAGVTTPEEYAVFQNAGYKGLYNGMTAKDIHTHKRLKKNQHILDYMGSEELAANLFRATQTDAKLRRDNIQGRQNANDTHYAVGRKVRQTIEDLGGTMPEDLPTPEMSIQQIERDEQKKLAEADSPQGTLF